ncbi:hypothetical protein LTS08_003714 [Lithohypha guttulata]|uniref:FAD-binding FR-type domain-containing protein n=1 Tax=Lithohypha guttulata TaxID=1690604 RepID=A0AAN7Y504_9EURO|nr:hypothetical protein LTR05_006023 [Lithohypha guttulata]KAK5102912.1 hypothetical protein LTS08_003714 [Lithohypha guttulata]
MAGTATMATSSPIPHTDSSHPSNPIPEEPLKTRAVSITALSQQSVESSLNTVFTNDNSSDIDTTPSTPMSDQDSDASVQELSDRQHGQKSRRRRRASTMLVSQDTPDAKLFLQGEGGATQMFQKACCGGGCCMLKELKQRPALTSRDSVREPNTHAYTSLNLRLNAALGLESELTELAELPEKTVSFESLKADSSTQATQHDKHPPNFVKPHPPYDVFSAPLYHARELTKPGAEKRTFHFDIDVTDYPEEGGDVEFRVGGAIGVCAPNDPKLVDQIFDRLGVPKFVRDKPVLLKTTKGRWPTIWGEDEARELVTTRRELLTWCTDIQSYPPTKQLFRLFAEHASDADEKQILYYLSSAQGQATFCDLRTGPYLTLLQLLHAFPSSMPPLEYLLGTLNQLMPRFYSLSQDPLVSHEREGDKGRRLIEVAVSVHESADWQGGNRTGVGSGFLERLAMQVVEAEKNGIDPKDLDLRVPMFRGLMANPLARQFVTDGPMLLIGAGVGVAPFRGFVHRRLKSANCANKVWVLQGVRDSLVDELYAGDWGVHEDKVKKVVQSRKAESRYVQEEVRAQADLVWFIINALDGRVFVCGSSKGMGEGVEAALIDVAIGKGGLNKDEAKAFWEEKKEAGQYIAETW